MFYLMINYPQTTEVADGEYAQANIHVVGIAIACWNIKIENRKNSFNRHTSLFAVNASQTITFPSCDELTICLLSIDQSRAKTLPWWPFKIRRDFVVNGGKASSFSATVVTN